MFAFGSHSRHAAPPLRTRRFTFPTENHLLRPVAEWLLDTRGLEELCSRASSAASEERVFDRLLQALDVHVRYQPADLERIPETGPLLLVANHPHGLLDGLILGSLLARRRNDFRLLANSVLLQVDEVRDYVIPVDVFGGRRHRNGLAARAAMRWMEGGGAIVSFPAGEVSAINGVPPQISDREWNAGTLGLAQRAGATVVHVFVSGHNSLGFQIAGVAHPGLRTLLLGRELLNKRGSVVQVAIGHAIPPARAAERGVEYLRRRTYLLRRRACGSGVQGAAPAVLAAVAPPQDAQALAANIAMLPPRARLFSAREYSVFMGTAAELPVVMPEIGRLREISFRAAGEGTGSACDLDRFDAAYDHLFLWNEEKREIVGAYRLGLVSRLARTGRPNGLYTHTLFRFGAGFLRSVSPGIELGRSFIRNEYQRNPHALFYLWRGIGAYIARHPEVRFLFGPVSISDTYQRASREVIVEYFRCNNRLPLAVNARNPFRVPVNAHWLRRFAGAIEDIGELSDVISDIEPDGKGVPVLLRHYLSLGARIAGFNVDHSFAGALDALIVVDLLHAPSRMLSKYMGREEHSFWSSHHV